MKKTVDARFYKEFKWARSLDCGNDIMSAYRWACSMRDCDYVLFLD